MQLAIVGCEITLKITIRFMVTESKMLLLRFF